MLAQMPRQILNLAPQSKIKPQTGIGRIQAGALKRQRLNVVRCYVLPGPHEARQPIEDFRRETEDFTDLVRGAAFPVSNDVSRHGGAMASVAVIDILNNLFAPVSARQIEIDVR